jgi:aryl-alcohol dehydrogenase-like predicted oxidoreductase
MNKLALGTVQFGLDYGITNSKGQVQIEEVKSILEYAKENNINILDTAASYGNSEEVLGNVSIDDFEVITKTIPLKNGANEVIKRFQQSLIYLNKFSVNGLLIHNINEIEHKSFDALFNKLNELKNKGLIKKIGFSAYTPEQVDFLLKKFDFDLIQVPFNILDDRLMQGGQLKVLNNKGIEVHVRSIFLQGLLLMSKQNRPRKFKRWDTLWKIWHEWLNDNQITALEAAIRHAISIPKIHKVLVGVETKKQLKDIVIASNGYLPKIPSELYSNDVNLLNPSNWNRL